MKITKREPYKTEKNTNEIQDKEIKINEEDYRNNPTNSPEEALKRLKSIDITNVKIADYDVIFLIPVSRFSKEVIEECHQMLLRVGYDSAFGIDTYKE